jgi:hypothetical protein
LRGGCVVIPSDEKAWASLPMPTEHSGPYNPLRRPPCAVKVACTVTTGGIGRQTRRHRALFLPTYPMGHHPRSVWLDGSGVIVKVLASEIACAYTPPSIA